jgi:S1-C subfamily serine protease
VNRQSLVAAAIAALALAGCGGGGEKAAKAPSPAPQTAVALEQAYNHVVDTVSPSVVQIATEAGLGSGIVLDNDGNIVTNAHVVGDSDRFTVTLRSGKQVHATLVGRWVPGDLAVVHADASDLTPATLGDSGKLQVGDIVMAMGNPLGLRSSVTQGIVSSLGRTVSEGNGATIAAAIQTSAAINPGNSGGALVNLQGQVVGIPTLAALDPELGGAQAPGIGFAIPSNTVKSIAQQLIKSGHVSQSGRASLGVSVATVTGGGVVIVAVDRGGPAHTAGLQGGDVIVAVDAHATPDVNALSVVLAGLKPGGQTTVTIQSRAGGREDHKVTLGELSG